jgi:hypothetical protein
LTTSITGLGISEEQKAIIFDIFNKQTLSVKTNVIPTGILSILNLYGC